MGRLRRQSYRIRTSLYRHVQRKLLPTLRTASTFDFCMLTFGWSDFVMTTRAFEVEQVADCFESKRNLHNRQSSEYGWQGGMAQTCLSESRPWIAGVFNCILNGQRGYVPHPTTRHQYSVLGPR